MSRFPLFPAVVLVLLLSTRQWSDPQAAVQAAVQAVPYGPYPQADQANQSAPYISSENPQLQEMAGMIEAMHSEFKRIRSSVSHLAELKAFEKRIAAMEARQDAAIENLSSRLNDTAAAMGVLQGAAVQNLYSRLDQTAAAMEVRQDAAAENLSSRLNHTAARQAAIEARQDAVMANFSSSLNETAAVMETCLAAIENLSSRLNDTVVDFCRTRRMGMSTGDIPDSSFTASSYYDHRFVPANARFGITRSWIPRTLTAEVEWLKVGLSC
ncbi:uncharacterized protein LOC118415515 [Branchiostoma floridae]|uniref:Uncharacterized protein LOC118415515 n=1 Tax=Branchiostoma floridae TaxID=7739 RepID=A0A9J7L589_BRAFL|nr:uncharacterized protein LOC118415515 [Branchiostoma floridae]